MVTVDIFSIKDFQELLGTRADSCVSIYVPTEPTGEQGQAGPIELKNLLTQAEERLIARQLRPATVRGMLQPAHDLQADRAFWKSQSLGLAVFLANGSLRAWRLPARFAPFAFVGNHFYIKPLLPLVEGEDQYFVLAVSQNEVKLYAGNRTSVSQIHVDELPKNLAEALHFHQPEGLFQVRSIHRAGPPAARGKSAKEGAVFHGQGAGGPEHHKDDILAYFRAINGALEGFLHGQSAPLLFAGVDYLFPIFREASSYPFLVDRPLDGNPALWNAVELFKRARPIVEPHWSRSRQRDARRIVDLTGTDLVSSDIEHVLPAAEEGRVDAVFVALDAQLWGSFDPATRRVDIRGGKQDGAEDLLELVARTVLEHQGQAYGVPVSDLPVGLLLAAHYRYPVEYPVESK